MTWDISGGRVRAGLAAGDTTMDTQITLAMDATLALIEQYCDRHFLYAEETEEFLYAAQTVSLIRYPIDVIQNVTGGTMGELNKKTGVLHISGNKHTTVRYKGGYKVLPAELLLAFWGTFDNLYAAMTTATGGGVSGSIKRLTITGVGGVDYDVSGGASTSTSGMFGGMMPAMATAILQLYRRELA